jgi:hypothetical protein
MKPRNFVIGTVIAAVVVPIADARVGSYGNNSRVEVSNRTNVNHNANVNNNVNVNRNVDVNRNVNVNNNVNVNRNVNVNVNRGGVVYHDSGYNWGAFAAGAAVGVATTAVVAAATRPAAVVVPAVGTIVGILPGECAAVVGAAAAIYHCGSIYYRPYYQGSSLVYQVVTYP